MRLPTFSLRRPKKPSAPEASEPAGAVAEPVAAALGPKRRLFQWRAKAAAARSIPTLESAPSAPETPAVSAPSASPPRKRFSFTRVPKAPKVKDAAPTQKKAGRGFDIKNLTKGKPKKAVGLPKAPRFILMIGDEGAILVHIGNEQVLGRYYAPDSAPDNVADFTKVLAAHPKAPVAVFIDTMDQSYIQQTLPPVSALSTGKLIKRRLDREFPTTELKGSLVLGREENDRKDWLFLMVALEQTPALKEWLEWLTRIPNHSLGIRLLPPETGAFVEALQGALGIEEEARKAWHFVVVHNKVSGFRQVIFKHGKMIFTRLGQPLNDAGADVAAGLVEQEVLSTLEYLKRLSFKENAALDLIIIAGQDIISAIDTKRLGITDVRLFTPHAVGELLKLTNATQPADRFGDVVLASSLSGVRKPVLKLWTKPLKKLEQMYQVFPLMRGAAALVLLWLLYSIGASAYDVFSFYGANSEFEEQKKTKQAALDQLRKESAVGSSRVDLQACKLEYSIVSPK